MPSLFHLGAQLKVHIDNQAPQSSVWTGEERRSLRAHPIHDIVLLVDPDAERAAAHAALLKSEGLDVRIASSIAAAKSQSSAAIIVVLPEPVTALPIESVVKNLHEGRPELPVILLTETRSVDVAVRALRAGVFDLITLPVNPAVFVNRVRRAIELVATQEEIEALRRQKVDTGIRLVGSSPAMQELRALVERVASSDVTVLVQGETGSGKELVVRTIHEHSTRHAHPFVGVNCAAVSPTLLEAELFGHVRGAFTDAKSSREGIFVQASGGTLFLDEIGDMTLDMQSKLLRALQERKVRPVGGNVEVAFDTRLISATHRNLAKMVQEGTFREDLLYRLNVVTLEVPPLRERGRDVVELAIRVLARAAVRDRRSALRLTPAVVDKLLAYEWRGNVRELENCMERLVALATTDAVVVDDLPDYIRAERDPILAIDEADDIVTLEELGDRYIRKVITLLNGDRTATAALLGIDKRTLSRRVEQQTVRRDGPGHLVAAPSLA
jgi:DNA-binding NtrC family response regulator